MSLFIDDMWTNDQKLIVVAVYGSGAELGKSCTVTVTVHDVGGQDRPLQPQSGMVPVNGSETLQVSFPDTPKTGKNHLVTATATSETGVASRPCKRRLDL